MRPRVHCRGWIVRVFTKTLPFLYLFWAVLSGQLWVGLGLGLDGGIPIGGFDRYIRYSPVNTRVMKAGSVTSNVTLALQAPVANVTNNQILALLRSHWAKAHQPVQWLAS